MSANDFGFQPDLKTLAMLGPLLQTLHGQTSTPSSDAMQQQQMDALSQRTQQAGQAAQQAQGQYQQAIQAPPPPPGSGSPMGDLLTRSLGNTAAVLGRNPQYAENANNNIAGQHAELLRQRLENISNLKDVYDQKAQMYQANGNMEMAEKNRLLEKKMLETQTELQLAMKDMEYHSNLQNQQQIARMHDEMMKAVAGIGAGARVGSAQLTSSGGLIGPGSMSNPGGGVGGGAPSAGAKPGVSGPPASPATPAVPPLVQKRLDNLTYTNHWGDQVLMTDPLKSMGKQGQMLTGLAADQGRNLADKNTVDRLRSVDQAMENIQTVKDAASKILPPDWQSRISEYGNRKMSDLLQTNTQRAAYGAYFSTAISTLKALVAGGGGNVRITQSQIDLALKNDFPTKNDTVPVAMQKLNDIETLLHTAVKPITSRNQSSGNALPNATGTQVKMLGTDGKTYMVDAAEKAEAIKNGWKVAQ